MTTPEENRPKTDKTDQVIFGEEGEQAARRAEAASEERGNVGRELEDALSEAGMGPEDLTGEEGEGGGGRQGRGR